MKKSKEDIIANARIKLIDSPERGATPNKSRNVLLGSLTEEQVAPTPLRNEALASRGSITSKHPVWSSVKGKRDNQNLDFYLKEREQT